MDRPEWMPETHLDKPELITFLICVGYHSVLRCSDPKASPEDKAMLPGLLSAMAELVKL